MSFTTIAAQYQSATSIPLLSPPDYSTTPAQDAINYIEEYSQNTINLINSCRIIQAAIKGHNIRSKLCKYVNISPNTNFIITPISKKDSYEHHPNRDWNEQINRYKKGLQMMWDDSQYNSAKRGDILIVWHYEKYVTFHFITDIYSPNNRLPLWSDNVGHSNRNVLYITPEFKYTKWSEWLLLGGPSRCMGTANVKKSKDNLIKYLKTIFKIN